MKFKSRVKILSIISLIIGLCSWSSLPANAASFSITASATQVAPGASFTVSVGGDCIGRINLKATGGTIAKSAVWVEENRETVSVVAGNSGNVTITATPDAGLSDSDGEEYKPGARSVTVKIVAPSQSTTQLTTNTTTSSSNTKPQTTSKPQTTTSTKPTTITSTNSTGTTEKPDSTSTETNTAIQDENTESQPEEPSNNSPEADVEQSEEQNNQCQNSSTEKLAWALVAILAVLFASVTTVLVYIVISCKPQHPKAAPTKSKKNSRHEKTN